MVLKMVIKSKKQTTTTTKKKSKKNPKLLHAAEMKSKIFLC